MEGLKKLGLIARTGGDAGMVMDQDSVVGELGQSAMAMPATQVWTALFALLFPTLVAGVERARRPARYRCEFVLQGEAGGHAVTALHDTAHISVGSQEAWATKQPAKPHVSWPALGHSHFGLAGHTPFALQLSSGCLNRVAVGTGGLGA